MARMRDYYVKDVAPALMKKFSYKSVMQIPKLEKIVVNVGCGEARDNPKVIDAIISDLGKITGQKAVPCKAKKSVANFKLREGMTIGAKVTLRGETMYEFFWTDSSTSLCPAFVTSEESTPTASMVEETTTWVCASSCLFPEIDYDKIDKVRGMDICFVTTANTDEEARELLALMGAPFAK